MNTHNTTLYAITLALVLASAGFFMVQAMADKEVSSREVLNYEHLVVGTETVVKYEYKGEKVPEKLAEDEVVALRTDNSYTRRVGTENAGTKEEKPVLNAIVYMTPQFIKEGDGWYYRETATSTESAFYRAHPEKYVKRLLANVAYAASLSPFSSSGDGDHGYSASGTFENPGVGFSDCTLEAYIDGFYTDDTAGTTAKVESYYRSTSFGSCRIFKVHLPFDTSSLGAGATVSAATVSVYVVSKVNGVDDGNDVIQVVQGSATFGSFGSTLGATGIDIGSISTSAYNTFTLDATGRGWVSTTGTTNLGLREYHDMLDSMSSNINGNSIVLSTSENTGTSQDPYMSITYTPGARSAFWQFQDF